MMMSVYPKCSKQKPYRGQDGRDAFVYCREYREAHVLNSSSMYMRGYFKLSDNISKGNAPKALHWQTYSFSN
jgi:hypothetical protein